jgi:hypothetical protein
MVEELSLSRASSEQQTENNAPRRTLELQADEATEGWRKLRNEELHNLFSPRNIFRKIK